MDPTSDRIIVLRPDSIAQATVLAGDHPHEKRVDLISGHDNFLFLARGEGTCRINGYTSTMRANTLIAAPAGSFGCALSEDRELYIISTRQTLSGPDDPRAFTPFLEHRFSAVEGRHWRDRIAGFADRAEAGIFDSADLASLKDAVIPLVWKRETHAVLPALLESVWNHLDDSLTLDRLAAEAGYTPNYLNDLMRSHTGRPVGRWITDMRMARARAALEHTDFPVAEVGAQSGYADPAYFSRAFRIAHGVPPVTWRIAKRPVDARHGSVAVLLDEIHAANAFASVPRRYSFAS